MTVTVTGFQFDADTLLSPISADDPTGPSLRYEGTYDLIASLRREDDPLLAQGVWKTELKRADWPRAAQTCIAALESKSKDIQIAAWLVEAWLHLYGFAGIREGLHVIAELCDTYWDSVHPDIENGDLEYRLAPIYWIEDKLSIAVRLIHITDPDAEGLSPYSLADWQMAGRRVVKPREEPPPDVVTEARFQKSAAATPTPWFWGTGHDLKGALGAVDELVEVLKARCGPAAPPLPKLRDALSSALHVVSTALDSRGALIRPIEEADDGAADAGIALVERTLDTPDPWRGIRSRAEAYQRLAEAADYLARTEPHSPVPHLIRRAIGWGSLSLEELLPELVRDSAQLAEIYRMLQLGEKP